MSDSNRRASGGSRRLRSSSTSSAASTASTVSSITEEDYDLIASAAVPDGFRPSGHVPNPSARRPVPPLSGPLLPPPQAVNPSFSKWNHRPSSVAKPPRPHDSLAIRADGSDAANTSQTGGNGVPPLRMEAPYRGPSNPVHPYGMYPQRTASNTTDRSARGNRPSSYAGPRGPTHPYTLYTQGTAAAPVEANQQAIPVGFGGIGTSYERQIGPDGEEIGDLLGPLGHTEELPPYSRYPEVAFATKGGASNAAAPAATGPAPAPARNSQDDEASGSQPVVNVAAAPETQNHTDAAPENPFASADDALVSTNTRHSRHSIRSVASYHDNPSSDESFSEKESRIQTKWQRRARKKLWGVIPYWSICLVFAGLLLGSVMGAVVGTVLTKSSTSDGPSQTPDLDETPNPTAVDIQPLPTVPHALLPLPVGPFSLPQLDGGRARRYCVNDTSQLPAWSCNMAFRFYSLNVLIDANQSATERYNMTLTPINNTQSQLLWGTQPPFIKDPVKLRLVNDSMDQDGRGPAWWTTVSYDKTVIVQESDLSPVQKRSWFYPGLQPATAASINSENSKHLKQSYQAQPGDDLWVCTWPKTVLEVLIYPGQNTSATATTPSTSASPSSSSSDASDSSHANFDWDDMPLDPLSPYPRLVRMLERRTANSGPAKCIKYRMGAHGGIKPQLSSTDAQPIEIVISENVNTIHSIHRPSHPYDGAATDDYKELDQDASGLVSRDALEFTPCGCLWSQ